MPLSTLIESLLLKTSIKTRPHQPKLKQPENQPRKKSHQRKKSQQREKKGNQPRKKQKKMRMATPFQKRRLR